MIKITDKYVIQEGKEYHIYDIKDRNKIIRPENLKFMVCAYLYGDRFCQNHVLIDKFYKNNGMYTDLVFEQLPKGTIWRTKIVREFEHAYKTFNFEANLDLEFPGIFRFYKTKPCGNFMFEITILEYIDTDDK